MYRNRRQPGFSLLETLVAVAIILTLVGVLAATGKKIRLHSEVELTQSTLAVLDAAMETYYGEQDAFVPMVVGEADFESRAGILVNVSPAGPWPTETWSNGSLYYFLDREPKSRAILQALSNRMVTGQDAAGRPMEMELSSGEVVPWLRVVDAWGTPLGYRYNSAVQSLPEIRSAGPDKVMDTEDDVIDL